MSFGGVDEQKLADAIDKNLDQDVPQWLAQLKTVLDKVLAEHTVKVTITFERTPQP